MDDRRQHDPEPHPQVGTTGHEWDGIRELNTPLPRWWLWLFYATIVWSVGYWVVYPAWPLVSSYTGGVFDWHSRSALVSDLAALEAKRSAMEAQLASSSLQQIESTQALLDFARALGARAFADNCAPCHGAGGGGAPGYPNLDDNDWLWGGTLADIQQTITHGVRSGDPQGHQGAMPAFGRDGMLPMCDIVLVANYVRSLSGLPTTPGVDLAAGAKIFAANCAVCHGPQGKGNRAVGAPNLTVNIWLYGPELQTIINGIWNGHGGVMPAWGGKLDPVTIEALTVYVHTFGGGE